MSAVDADLLFDDPRGVTTLVHAIYDDRDPLVVAFDFPGRRTRTGRRDPIRWLIGRDLLAAGLLLPTGDGDVYVAPEGEMVVLELTTPTGHAVQATPLVGLARFLDLTEQLVPYGQEVTDDLIDQALATLLGA